MRRDTFAWRGLDIPVIRLDAAVVGSGAAGFAAACRLNACGINDVAVVTEGVNSGTSRNTGSDKQTYYKLSLAGAAGDSVQAMAEALFAGGSMDGDTALAESALSARAFLRLVELGVPFPHNEYGEYAGYRTDHDERLRATSAGPLTSRYMTEALEADARARGIPVLDGLLAVALLTSGEGGERACLGLVALDTARLQEPARGLTLIRAANVVWATGGEAGLFSRSVYPESQHGALGVALEAGAGACNLQEWQHGLASTAFRWNVSGTYQQALPRYISTDGSGGDEREFLLEYCTAQEALAMTFLKGYQWPFDARKVPGSSLMDLYVHIETALRGRRVFLDYRSNPAGLEAGFGCLTEECRQYLENSGALFGTPLDRLAAMNPGAVALYRGHGIDLARQGLEVAVCAQHMNGGLEVDARCRTSIAGLYACGEAAGAFGAYRPGGSALNSTQTGALRAAADIAARMREAGPAPGRFAEAAAAALARAGARALGVPASGSHGSLRETLGRARRRMGLHGAFLREEGQLIRALDECRRDIETYWQALRIDAAGELPDAFRGWDMLLSQFACLSSMLAYARAGGPSRGSALLLDDGGQPLAGTPWKCRPYDRSMDAAVLQARLQTEAGGPVCACSFRPARPIPTRDLWFESVWAAYRAGHGTRQPEE